MSNKLINKHEYSLYPFAHQCFRKTDMALSSFVDTSLDDGSDRHQSQYVHPL